MAGLIPDSVLSDLRNIFIESTGASASVDRTGITIPVRVNPDTDQVRLPGLAHFLPLRRWLLTFPHAAHADWAGTGLERGDVATVAGEQYLTVMVEKDETYNVRVVGRALQLAGTVTASTKRDATATDPGTQSSWTTHIAALTAYQFIENQALLPTNTEFVNQLFGSVAAQPQVLYCLSPTPIGGEQFAIQPNDQLVLSGNEYDVLGIETWNRLTAVYVAAPIVQ